PDAVEENPPVANPRLGYLVDERLLAVARIAGHHGVGLEVCTEDLVGHDRDGRGIQPSGEHGTDTHIAAQADPDAIHEQLAELFYGIVRESLHRTIAPVRTLAGYSTLQLEDQVVLGFYRMNSLEERFRSVIGQPLRQVGVHDAPIHV